MPEPFTRLADSVAVQYSELLRHAVRPAPDGSNLSFKSKAIGGRSYLYLYVSLGRRRTEHYLGPETPELLARVDAERALWESGADERLVRSRSVAMLTAGGATPTAGDEGKVLALLERGGVFLAGGVLVGPIAFKAYANMLGVAWTGETATRDVDIATDRRLGVAVPPRDVRLAELLVESGMGFLEVPSLDRKAPATEFRLRGRELSVELLTPMTGRPSAEPVFLESLGAWAEPMRFVDFLLEDARIAVLLHAHGVLVNVPAPGRFALHELAVSRRRPSAFAEKARRDLIQAATLLRVLVADRPGDVVLAGEAVRRTGGEFEAQVAAGLGVLDPDLATEVEALSSIGPAPVRGSRRSRRT